MKILFYISTICGGGAARVMVNLANALSTDNEVYLVTNFLSDSEYVVYDTVKRYYCEKNESNGNRFVKNVTRIRELRKLIKKLKPDVSVAFMSENNFRLILSSFGLKTKTIVSVRNDPNREYGGKLGKLIGKHLLPLADGCVFQTKDAKGWFPEKLQKKSEVIMNETSKEFFDIEYVGGNNIVTLGRLAPQKNHKLLIEAFATIADKYPNVNLKIYGDGALKDSLCELIEKLNMKDRICLMGSTTNVGNVLSTAKAFVMSSDYEGMPNALLEALTVGVPSISTDCPCGGPKELIENGVNGLLVKTNDKDDMVVALERILGSDKDAEEMGKRARERASKYHPDIIFHEWKKYIESVVNK